jgi:zinc/manganese transport system permease protein
MDILSLLLKPFLACLILSAMHVYLGFHVLKRGIIFVDLALAQVAALGATIGFLLGYGLHSNWSYALSLISSISAALIFSRIRYDSEQIPAEAYIGIVYAVASAGAILVLSIAPEGGEELKSLLLGHLLFVDWHEIIKIAAIYSLLGLFYWLYRKQFLAISESYKQAPLSGLKVQLWDFLFYASFGVVVTSSVELAGVLLVFSFLVVPSVAAALIAKGVRARLLVGWIVALTSSLLGLFFSYQLDLPSGACIVIAFAVMLCVCLLSRAKTEA